MRRKVIGGIFNNCLFYSSIFVGDVNRYRYFCIVLWNL